MAIATRAELRHNAEIGPWYIKNLVKALLDWVDDDIAPDPTGIATTPILLPLLPPQLPPGSGPNIPCACCGAEVGCFLEAIKADSEKLATLVCWPVW